MPHQDYEQKLLRNLIKGDIGAFEEIYRKYNKKIYTLSVRYLKNKEDAEGIVQEVFFKLWQNCAKLREDSNLNAWLFTITFHAIRKRFRDLSRQKKHLKEYEASIFKDKKEEVIEIEYNELLDEANHLIEKLPPQQKRIFLLRREKGYTSKEIADQLHISKKTVDNHLNRARSFLRKAMEEEGLLAIVFFWLFIH
jgi:RNA polymerase sigma-70 factor (family 1)